MFDVAAFEQSLSIFGGNVALQVLVLSTDILDQEGVDLEVELSVHLVAEVEWELGELFDERCAVQRILDVGHQLLVLDEVDWVFGPECVECCLVLLECSPGFWCVRFEAGS